ncbi:MAG: hypothetical protein PHU06_01490 [Gallionella sp.]|nr:hypothetical protein [Gallionella sp.]MDD4957879.1 hypothetical protein [Gallionella sp.]
MRYIILGLLFICQSVFALDTSESAQTRYGQLEVKVNDKGQRELRLDTRVLYVEAGYFGMYKIIPLGEADVILVKKTPSTTAPAEFFFITLLDGTVPMTSESFVAGEKALRPVVDENKIVVNLGLRHGNLEIATYQAGKVSVEKTAVVGKKAKEEYCDYLYQQIYRPYSQGKQCVGAPEETVLAEGESPAEVYRRLMDNDPRLDEVQFQKLAKSSCLRGKAVQYSAFQKQVCGW